MTKTDKEYAAALRRTIKIFARQVKNDTASIQRMERLIEKLEAKKVA